MPDHICSQKCDTCPERDTCNTPAAVAEVEQWHASGGKMGLTLDVAFAVGLATTIWGLLGGMSLDTDGRVVLRKLAADITASLPEGPTRRELEGLRSLAFAPSFRQSREE